MLSAGAGKADFRNILSHAFTAGASGFLAGRAIWLDAFNHYPAWDDIHTNLVGASRDYMYDICELASKEALDWRQHPCYGAKGAAFSPPDASFRQQYDAL